MTQHINQSPSCLTKQSQEVSIRQSGADQPLADADQGDGHETRRRSRRLQSAVDDQAIMQRTAPQIGFDYPADPPALDAFPLPNDDESSGERTEPRAPQRLPNKHMMDDSAASSDDSVTMEAEKATDEAEGRLPNTELLRKFRNYCDEHSNNFLRLRKEEATCVKLMNVLRKKAPLNVYSEVLEWHLKETGRLQEHESLGDIEHYQHRKTLMKRMLPRYNLLDMVPIEKKVRLPSSKAVVSIPCRDAGECLVSLLTDPRFEDEDYLFFNDNPLAPPPEQVTYLEDLNTGDAYLKTHEKMITNDRQVLLPVPLYIDGANTGQFNDLPVTALKMSLGIHKRAARDRDYAWRELGFVPVVRKDPARGKKIFQESGHLESLDVIVLEGEGDATNPMNAESDGDVSEEEAVHAQDFHTMLSVILESFVELQRTGFVWDLVYKGKLYRNIEFIVFVPFVKCDSEEGDLLCGKYTVRTSNVKQVCRYCHCPTNKADDPRANYKLKTQSEIQKLVQKGKLDRLQSISQQNIQNAWYDVTFHAANECGIHGACPSEKLHAIQLGIFKYIREIFFVHMGKSSQLAEDVNGLATMYGKLLTRQSERDLPNTNFAKGIQKGKLMARDFRGVLLIMAAVLRSTQGRELLFQRRKFGREEGLRDWTLLVELMLEWEAYLGERKMRRSHVKRLAKKHRFIMYIMKCVARRTTGMGLKVMKFHAILHLINDMLLYGVPSEFDTGSNESHHKSSKHAARLTQRKEASFNSQTARRLTEFHCIDLAMEEILYDRCVWEYFHGAEDADLLLSQSESDSFDAEMADVAHDGDDSDTEANDSDTEANDSDTEAEAKNLIIQTGGTRIKVFEDEEKEGEVSFRILSRSKTQANTVWVTEVVEFLNDLQNLVLEHINEPFLPILTMHKRGSNTFYGHPNFRSSGPWKDWVLIDWDSYGVLPSHIWCFVELSNMPKGNQKLQFGGITLQDDVYAVVEVANYNLDIEEATKSDLFTPLVLEVEGFDSEGDVLGRKFYLANTDAFVGPCCVIPDIGGDPNAYFQVKPRRDWTKEFIQWLEAPHADDVMQHSDEEDDD